MKKFFRYIILLLFSVLIFIFGYILITTGKINILLSDLAVQSCVFAFISLITLIIFFRGQKKEHKIQTFYSLVAVSLKLLLEMVFALIWFILAKKTGLASVLLFFVLYLAFTLFSLIIILKTLKHKSLENKY